MTDLYKSGEIIASSVSGIADDLEFSVMRFELNYKTAYTPACDDTYQIEPPTFNEETREWTAVVRIYDASGNLVCTTTASAPSR